MIEGLEALERIKWISLTHFGYDKDENMDGEWEYEPVDVDDGTIEENYPEEIKIIETELKTLEKYIHIEEELGISLTELFNYDKSPFAGFEIEQEDDTIFFDGDSFYGYYSKDKFLELIKRMLKAYIETWGTKDN